VNAAGGAYGERARSCSTFGTLAVGMDHGWFPDRSTRPLWAPIPPTKTQAAVKLSLMAVGVFKSST